MIGEKAEERGKERKGKEEKKVSRKDSTKIVYATSNNNNME